MLNSSVKSHNLWDFNLKIALNIPFFSCTPQTIEITGSFYSSLVVVFSPELRLPPEFCEPSLHDDATPGGSSTTVSAQRNWLGWCWPSSNPGTGLNVVLLSIGHDIAGPSFIEEVALPPPESRGTVSPGYIMMLPQEADPRQPGLKAIGLNEADPYSKSGLSSMMLVLQSTDCDITGPSSSEVVVLPLPSPGVLGVQATLWCHPRGGIGLN